MVWLASPTTQRLSPAAEPQVQQPLLERADVLVLVDDEVLVLRADLVRDVGAVLQDADREQQHVLEVDDAAVALELLVRRVDLGDLGRVARGLAAGLRGRGRVVVGHGLGDLGPFDLAGDVPQLVAVQPDPAARPPASATRTRGSASLVSISRAMRAFDGRHRAPVLAAQAGQVMFLFMPGQAYESGIGFIHNYFGQPLALIVVCAVFVPIYQRLKVYTAYQYLGERFTGRRSCWAPSFFL